MWFGAFTWQAYRNALAKLVLYHYRHLIRVGFDLTDRVIHVDSNRDRLLPSSFPHSVLEPARCKRTRLSFHTRPTLLPHPRRLIGCTSRTVPRCSQVRRDLKGVRMKTCPRIITAIASLLLLAGGSSANAQYNHLVASVPFEFMIGERTIPRDIYQVSRVDGHTDFLLVQSALRCIFIFVNRLESEDGYELPRLVFHRYDDQYFLREILFPGRLGLSLPETSEEREAAKRNQRAD